ncbi:hypothetical protein SEUCBS140593_000265 [Sporothrix eucalyptigena]|uniref:Major facilitator superfamily (MFS) profile domain-containing protein n=1 Tax=Sporothrix eucalyptigena TaxID=1812306 RepID=A0ABP0AN96_9PEZI
MTVVATGFRWSDLYRPPDLNPINHKARSVPILNPINMYGRVFFFSWFGFMVAFWAWYAFPPLLTVTIKADLNLTMEQVANSNTVSLCATLLVRVVSGPLCDLFGPRKVFGGLLLLGAIPTGLASLIHNGTGLYAVRFFMGILGGSFVPCQVWSTTFFDKNIVGTANAMTGGFGNAGGGITYIIMPAVFNSLTDHQGYTDDTAWRLTFLVPLVVVLVTGVALLVLCPDTPDGNGVGAFGIDAAPPIVATNLEDEDKLSRISLGHSRERSANRNNAFGANISSPSSSSSPPDSSPGLRPATTSSSHEVRLSSTEMLETVRGEIVQPPSAAEVHQVTFSPHTWALMLAYMCSFGAELAINAVLSSYYLHNFPSLGQTGASNWASMFGFLNLVTRPIGGIVADLLYGGGHGSSDHAEGHGNLWWKKHWITVCGVLSGVSLVIVGCLDSEHEATMFGLVALCAVFLEAGNGANFALVPHVHPFANGIVSGLTGAAGNVGGIIFSVIFRFVTHASSVPRGPALMDYGKAFWIIGIIHIAVNLSVSWISPIPKNQIGGH